MKTGIRIASYCILAGLIVLAKHFWDLKHPKMVFRDAPKVVAEDPALAKQRQSVIQLQGHSAGVTGVAFFHDGKRAVTCSADHSVRVWDLSTGNEIQKLEAHGEIVDAVAVSPDDSLIASSGNDMTCRIWQTATGDEVGILEGHTGWATSVCFDGNDKVITGSLDPDSSIRVWDVAKEQCVTVLKGHSGGVVSMAVSPDGTKLVTSGYDKTVRLWDCNWGISLRTWKFPGYVSCVGFLPDGKSVFAAYQPFQVKLLSTETGSTIVQQDLPPDTLPFGAVSPDGEYYAAATQFGAHVFHLPSFKEAFVFGDRNDTGAGDHGLRFSPDGRFILVAFGGYWLQSGQMQHTLGNVARLFKFPPGIGPTMTPATQP